ncbi:anhydro-N-acetylmuramic acid kinase [Fischerella thermalis CCMEE 5201]|nr:anhydro-N-acetylmuramic acid kinase [Fischerella thermalis CCMEE 5201]
MTRVIGLISGTSVDGIDAALVDISGTDFDLQVEFVAGVTYSYQDDLRERILAVCAGQAISMAELAELDDAIAIAFAQAAQNIQVDHQPATLIGSHGQTVYHRPAGVGDRENTSPRHRLGYTLQLGRGAVIAQLTGITTVNNFRVADIAAGGQGAPLVSPVDAALFSHPQEARCIQNIGGISNLTYLPPRQDSQPDHWLEKIRGWDTGPGNSLLDLAVQYITNGTKTYDENGSWAASGTPCHALVEHWLEQEYFHLPPPKSTGRELFGVDYLQECIKDSEPYQLSPADLLATLTELTAVSIVHNYHSFLPKLPERVFLCGGGSRNLYLKNRLQQLLEPVPVLTTDEVGLSADFKEAIAFAVLAYWRQLGFPGNLPTVTGASKRVLLGEINFSQ